jgi:Domain of unknown function (DUF1707)
MARADRGRTTLRTVPQPREHRVSDLDRERVARELRDHFAAGRLTEDELSERVQAAYEARTESELRALAADLPQLPATRADERAELARRRGDLQRRLLQQSGGAIVPFAICTVIWFASGASGMFWPIWLALFALIPMLRNGWRLYGPAPELERVERELARRESGARGRVARPHRHRRRR